MFSMVLAQSRNYYMIRSFLAFQKRIPEISTHSSTSPKQIFLYLSSKLSTSFSSCFLYCSSSKILMRMLLNGQFGPLQSPLPSYLSFLAVARQVLEGINLIFGLPDFQPREENQVVWLVRVQVLRGAFLSRECWLLGLMLLYIFWLRWLFSSELLSCTSVLNLSMNCCLVFFLKRWRLLVFITCISGQTILLRQFIQNPKMFVFGFQWRVLRNKARVVLILYRSIQFYFRECQVLCNRDWKNDSKRLPFINEANFISIFRDSTNWNRKKNSPGGSLRKRGMKASTPSSRNLSTVQTSKTKNGCRPNSPSFIPGAGKRISMRLIPITPSRRLFLAQPRKKGKSLDMSKMLPRTYYNKNTSFSQNQHNFCNFRPYILPNNHCVYFEKGLAPAEHQITESPKLKTQACQRCKSKLGQPFDSIPSITEPEVGQVRQKMIFDQSLYRTLVDYKKNNKEKSQRRQQSIEPEVHLERIRLGEEMTQKMANLGLVQFYHGETKWRGPQMDNRLLKHNQYWLGLYNKDEIKKIEWTMQKRKADLIQSRKVKILCRKHIKDVKGETCDQKFFRRNHY